LRAAADNGCEKFIYENLIYNKIWNSIRLSSSKSGTHKEDKS